MVAAIQHDVSGTDAHCAGAHQNDLPRLGVNLEQAAAAQEIGAIETGAPLQVCPTAGGTTGIQVAAALSVGNPG